MLVMSALYLLVCSFQLLSFEVVSVNQHSYVSCLVAHLEEEGLEPKIQKNVYVRSAVPVTMSLPNNCLLSVMLS